MPLSVEIKLNGMLIETINIERIEPLRGNGMMHQYLATVRGKPEHVAEFGHFYNEGAQECVRRALEALAAQKERRDKRGKRG